MNATGSLLTERHKPRPVITLGNVTTDDTAIVVEEAKLACQLVEQLIKWGILNEVDVG